MQVYFNKIPVYQHDPTGDQDQMHTILLNGIRIETGLKWQCVELARRYLLVTKGITFPSIPNAYDIFNLHHMINVFTGRKALISRHANGSTVVPTIGSLLIWGKEYDKNETGHVAVITSIYQYSIQIMEQNNSTSHRIIPTFYKDKHYYILDKNILGWILV